MNIGARSDNGSTGALQASSEGSIPFGSTKMKLGNYDNSNKQGNAGLGQAIAWFTTNGYSVSIPLTDTQDYDLIVDNGTISRVQVKTTKHKDGNNFVIDLRVRGGYRGSPSSVKKFDNSKVELIFAVTGDGDNYLIESKSISNTSWLTLVDKFRL